MEGLHNYINVRMKDLSMKFQNFLKMMNLSLLILFPLSWTFPLFEIGLIKEIDFDINVFGHKIPTLFGLEEITILTSVQSIWSDDKYLAILVAFFALFAPMFKIIGLALVQFGITAASIKGVVMFLGRLGMADIFLIALGCVLVKGIDIGQINITWGTYFFSFCVVLSLVVSNLTRVDPSND
jgi:paraquat-inducible protein A